MAKNKDEKAIFYDDPHNLAESFLYKEFKDIYGERLQKGVESDSGRSFYRLRHWQGGFYLYVGGKYIEVTEETIKKLITAFIVKLNEIELEGKIRPTSYVINNVLLNVKTIVTVSDFAISMNGLMRTCPIKKVLKLYLCKMGFYH